MLKKSSLVDPKRWIAVGKTKERYKLRGNLIVEPLLASRRIPACAGLIRARTILRSDGIRMSSNMGPKRDKLIPGLGRAAVSSAWEEGVGIDADDDPANEEFSVSALEAAASAARLVRAIAPLFRSPCRDPSAEWLRSVWCPPLDEFSEGSVGSRMYFSSLRTFPSSLKPAGVPAPLMASIRNESRRVLWISSGPDLKTKHLTGFVLKSSTFVPSRKSGRGQSGGTSCLTGGLSIFSILSFRFRQYAQCVKVGSEDTSTGSFFSPPFFDAFLPGTPSEPADHLKREENLDHRVY